MSRQRVLVVVPKAAVAPDNAEQVSEKEFEEFKAAYDVMLALEELGHQGRQLGLLEDVAPLRRELREWEPTIVFNLLDRFRGYTFYDQHLTSYLQLMRLPFTGCNPRGLMIASDKALAKKIVVYHRIRTPRFQTFLRNRQVRRSKQLRFPLIVKVHLEEASSGIAQASVVQDDEQLRERVQFVHERFETAAVVEEYIEGRELNVGVIGNQRLQVMPVWELFMDKLPAGTPKVATYNVKLEHRLPGQVRDSNRSGPQAARRRAAPNRHHHAAYLPGAAVERLCANRLSSERRRSSLLPRGQCQPGHLPGRGAGELGEVRRHRLRAAHSTHPQSGPAME
jgi:D-alanine-D-alanine ligase